MANWGVLLKNLKRKFLKFNFNFLKYFEMIFSYISQEIRSFARIPGFALSQGLVQPGEIDETTEGAIYVIWDTSGSFFEKDVFATVFSLIVKIIKEIQSRIGEYEVKIVIVMVDDGIQKITVLEPSITNKRGGEDDLFKLISQNIKIRGGGGTTLSEAFYLVNKIKKISSLLQSSKINLEGIVYSIKIKGGKPTEEPISFSKLPKEKVFTLVFTDGEVDGDDIKAIKETKDKKRFWVLPVGLSYSHHFFKMIEKKQNEIVIPVYFER